MKAIATMVDFRSKTVLEDDGCWRWLGNIDPSNGRPRCGQRYAYRVAYALFREPLSATVEVHHTCGNRACVNPEHLEALDHVAHVSRHAQPLVHGRESTYTRHRCRCHSCRLAAREARARRRAAR